MGTLDISLLNISDGVFQVIASTGNTHLGGSDFDARLMQHCISSFNKTNRLDIIPSAINLQKLKKSCENAKKKLSFAYTACIKIPNFYETIELNVNINKSQFEEICNDLLILCMKPLADIIELTKITVDEIIMVGGATRMPCIRESVTNYFKKSVNVSINPDEAVAIGAGIQAYMLSHKDDPFCKNITLMDSTALSLGVEVMGGIMDIIIPRSSTIPIKKTRRYTPDSDNQTSVKIKIFEGERSMTSDNFLIGEFELIDLKSAPRGVVKIDITFSIDINSIISVTAETIDDDNKKTIQIKSNTSRLSEKQLDDLVNQANANELIDKLQREKRQLYYEIEDICNVIKYNINNNTCKLNEEDKISTINDINSVKDWLTTNPYDKINDKKEYYDILSRLKSKYTTLILRINSDDILPSEIIPQFGTSVYNDSDNAENDNKNSSSSLKIRDELTNLCHSMQTALDGFEDTELIKELKYTIDDALLWIYIKENLSDEECQSKINEINNIADHAFDNGEYKITRQHLYELCLNLIDDENINIDIKQYINNVLYNIESINVQEVYNKIIDYTSG